VTGGRVLVTGVGGGIGQSIEKSLQATPYEVVGMDPDALAAGLHAVPVARLGRPASDPQFVESVLGAARDEGCALVLPGIEPELLPLATSASAFAEHGVTTVVSPPEVIRLCDDKLATAAFLTDAGFGAPDTVPFTADVDPTWFPFVMKPQRGGARSVRTYVVHDRAEFDIASRLVDPDNCVIQEYLDGDEYTCGTVNLDGTCAGVIAMRRTLRAGDTYKAFVVRDPAIEEHVRHVADALRPFGACNFQLRLRAGTPCIFEINSRCSGTTYARTLAGFNEPKMIADFVLHGVVPSYEIREITVLRYWKELPVPNDRIAALQERGRLDDGDATL
jgi:carbamoyl-phosphate synthase large subunit